MQSYREELDTCLEWIQRYKSEYYEACEQYGKTSYRSLYLLQLMKEEERKLNALRQKRSV